MRMIMMILRMLLQINLQQVGKLDADILLTGKDYESFHQVFEGFNGHLERLVVKTYENNDPEKEKERELKEAEADRKRLEQ